MVYELRAEVRSEKNPRAIRRRGRIPGVVYGPGVYHQVAFDRKELEGLLNKITRSSRISLELNGKRFDTFIKEIQYDLFTDQVIHLDLYQPPTNRAIAVEVPIRLQGESKGRKSGGVVYQLREVVKVRGPSTQIPELIELDITELDIGQALHASEVKLADGLQLLTPPEAVLVTILAQRKEEVVAPVAAAVEGEAVAAAEGAEGAPAGAAGAAAEGKEEVGRAAPAGAKAVPAAKAAAKPEPEGRKK
jgi:large subunit ribosomal protein L25